MVGGSIPLNVAIIIFVKVEAQWVGGAGVRGHWELEFHFHHKPLLRREIRILAQLGLGVAPRFLQKVRARPEILTNKLGLLPRREAAEAAQALTYFSKFRGLGPNFL